MPKADAVLREVLGDLERGRVSLYQLSSDGAKAELKLASRAALTRYVDIMQPQIDAALRSGRAGSARQSLQG